jgi:hypothetical protein
MTNVTGVIAIVAGLCVGAAGCASNPARASAAVPLNIPEPPPKTSIPPVAAPDEPPEQIVATPLGENPTAAAPAARPPIPRREPTGAVPAPSTSSTPVGPPPVTPEPSTPAPDLRPAGAAAKALTPTQVRESYDRTKQKLDAIDRRRLNSGKRSDYDAARGFLGQADSAIKANDLLMAQSSVEKAEALANGLR